MSWCNICESNPCSCRKALAPVTKPLNWIIQYCTTQGCDTAIRVQASQSLVTPVCTWCDQKVSHATQERSWPWGMPNPELPWPWMTEQDRERKLRTPYWKDVILAHKEMYKAWLRT